jgi:membrane protein YqaA with SNARE-associated domain
MARLLTWLIELRQNPALRRLGRRLAPYADRPWFPPLAGFLAFAATLSFTVPVVPVLCTLVAINRRRWLWLALWAVLGSAAAGALFTHLLGHFGTAFLAEKLPQLVVSKHWHLLVKWVSSYGFISLAAIAVSPIAQTPALILAALLGMPWFEVFASLALGKGVKYTLMAALTAKTAGQVIEYYEREEVAISVKRKSWTEGP